MEDIDKIKQRFELLKISRELLNEDYINKRAMAHNKWVTENDEMWRKHRRQAPYPEFVPYPTDEEIVKAARNLYEFIYNEAANKEEPLKSFSEGDYVFPRPEEPVANEILIEQEEVKESIPEEIKPVEEIKPNEEVKPVEVKGTTLLPGWIRRTLS